MGINANFADGSYELQDLLIHLQSAVNLMVSLSTGRFKCAPKCPTDSEAGRNFISEWVKDMTSGQKKRENIYLILLFPTPKMLNDHGENR